MWLPPRGGGSAPSLPHKHSEAPWLDVNVLPRAHVEALVLFARQFEADRQVAILRAQLELHERTAHVHVLDDGPEAAAAVRPPDFELVRPRVGGGRRGNVTARRVVDGERTEQALA